VLCVKVSKVDSTRPLAEALIALGKKMHVFNWLLTFRERTTDARKRASPLDRAAAVIRERARASPRRANQAVKLGKSQSQT